MAVCIRRSFAQGYLFSPGKEDRMKKVQILGVFLLIISAFCFSVEAGAAKKEQWKLPKEGTEYEAYQLELESYQKQSHFQKMSMEQAYQSFLLYKNESSLVSYKEAELSYAIASFYEKRGRDWLDEKWRLEEGAFLCRLASYQRLKAEYHFRQTVLRSLRKKYKEALQKQKKGQITRWEPAELQCQVLSAREQFRQKRQEIRSLKKEIQQRSKKRQLSYMDANRIKQTKWYLSRWKKGKSAYQQISYQIAAYQTYKQGFDADKPEQNRHISYADTEIRRLQIKKVQDTAQMNKMIQQKRITFQNAKRLRNQKDREISLAQKKYRLLGLLKKKGKVVRSQVLEQKAELARLESEKAAYQYDMNVAAIQLAYGMEEQ